MTDSRETIQSAKAGQGVINRKIGLEQYDNDEEVYSEILKYFAKSNKNTFKNLKDAIGVGNIKLAHRKVHSLRGAAGTIGAEGLVRAALDVEKKLATMCGVIPNFSDEKTLDEQMLLLEREYDALFEEIGIPVCKDEEVWHYSGIPAMNREKALKILEKIDPFLETGDTKCIEYLEEITEVFHPVADGFRLFILQMELYDFKNAYETMINIRRFMTP